MCAALEWRLGQSSHSPIKAAESLSRLKASSNRSVLSAGFFPPAVTTSASVTGRTISNTPSGSIALPWRSSATPYVGKVSVKDSKASPCNPFFAESDLEGIAIHGKKTRRRRQESAQERRPNPLILSSKGPHLPC